MAFFPCVYFCQMSQYMQSLGALNYRSLTAAEAIDKILDRQNRRNEYLQLLTKLVAICLKRSLRLVFENPITDSFLNNYFLKQPDIKDMDRRKSGDCYKKPTGFWFFGCKPTFGESFTRPPEEKTVTTSKQGSMAGLCSEERSMISPAYARNFICDHILGREQVGSQRMLFNEEELA